ncbi:angiopoietin-related protein 7-like isoform X1 [Colias croceus]|uniref:angiopoietin-related protein 7-like isoform X1 n=1 Tax=Colias crocea TaxID=72248 RepID=UPI001E27EB99|nr:angiopoietin-related protein 7-like isoform X1 [Colias croceus]
MVRYFVILIFLTGIICDGSREKQGKRKNDVGDKSLWKKEYESELTDAMLSSKRLKNATRIAQSPTTTDNEMVIEKLVESITSSEQYLKKVESIDFRLNRLDIEIHEKTNSILKYLTEIIQAIQNMGNSESIEPALEKLNKDISEIKLYFEKNPRATGKVEGAEYQVDASLDSRLAYLESHMKNIMTSIESIASVISEVKTRQSARIVSKPDAGGSLEAIGLISEFRRALQEQKMKKCDCKFGRVDRVERYPTDCQEIQLQGFNVSGIYKIRPDDMEPFYVLCDLNTVGGGWTVIQNRFDGSQDFYKSWSDYKHGFGNLAGEFWLGLEKLNYLTNQKLYELRIEMEAQTGQEVSASYSVFTVGPEYEGYRISTLGSYRGNAGDSLSYHAGQKFSTFDVDNDEWRDGACAVEHGGSWWYKECDKSNLNGKYTTPEEHHGQSIYWISFMGPSSPLAKTRMMIRPLPASRPADTEQSRKILDAPKPRPSEKQKPHKDVRGPYDMARRPPYRYEDAERFFPTYA